MLDMHTSLKLSNLYVLGPICSLICQRRNRCKDQLITFPVSHGWLVMELESNPGSWTLGLILTISFFCLLDWLPPENVKDTHFSLSSHPHYQYSL